MDFFNQAKAVRMRNVHNKYLTADEDKETVTHDRNGSDKRVKWIVEPVRGSFEVIRLRSCYGNYLTASKERFLLGATGRKVVLSKPAPLDSSVEWEPVREGSKLKLKTKYGNLLRANGGLPPWRNSVTHGTPHVSDSFLWDVDVVEILEGTADPAPVPAPVPVRIPAPPPPPLTTPQPHGWKSYSYDRILRFLEHLQKNPFRLKSCHGRYLTASNEGLKMKLRSRNGGNYLRANGGVPPWRNKVTSFWDVIGTLMWLIFMGPVDS